MFESSHWHTTALTLKEYHVCNKRSYVVKLSEFVRFVAVDWSDRISCVITSRVSSFIVGDCYLWLWGLYVDTIENKSWDCLWVIREF